VPGGQKERSAGSIYKVEGRHYHPAEKFLTLSDHNDHAFLSFVSSSEHPYLSCLGRMDSEMRISCRDIFFITHVILTNNIYLFLTRRYELPKIQEINVDPMQIIC
jgi:hypothetical protein